jgi:hypothetical protein
MSRYRVKNCAGAIRATAGLAGVVVCLVGRPLTAAQETAPIEAPTPVEQALIEQQCNATRASSVGDSDAYHTCLSTQLQAIRQDFGRDLSRLSAAERRAMDAVCNKVRNLEGRDEYVACLGRQLAALHARRTPNPTTAAAAVPDLSALTEAVATAPPPPESHVMRWSVLGGIALMAAAAGAFLLTHRRRPTSTCRTCGAAVPGGGDLCQACRHEAAEALRRAALDRVEQEQHEKDEAQRHHAREEAWRLEQLRQQELVRRQELERAQREGETRREEEERRREEEARERSQFGAEAEFDPYSILGLAPDADRQSIESAYEQAKSKYDADQVAHLSTEVQEHFKRKALAVERAYQMLTAAV